MAEIVRTYENIPSAKDPVKEVQLTIYSDGTTREIDYATRQIVTRTNPTEVYKGANVNVATKNARVEAKREAILASDGIAEDHAEYLKLCELLDTWLGSGRSDAGMRAFNAYQQIVGGVALIEVLSPRTIIYDGDIYQNWNKNGEVVLKQKAMEEISKDVEYE